MVENSADYEYSSSPELLKAIDQAIIAANTSEEYHYTWRGVVDGEECKIHVATDDFSILNLSLVYRSGPRTVGASEEA